jgi:ABC-2 type transport system permease protein
MKKYITVFQIDWQNQFIYRLNFVLWRVRNILRLLMTYFLWSGIFVGNQVLFGYSKPQMLTYVFMVLAVQSIVLSAPSADNIGGEIGSGDLSNYLVKPISYLRYWFVRDLSSKLLNLLFAIGEITLLYFIIHPYIQFPSSIFSVVTFLISCIFATIIYYFVNVSSRLVSFWAPEYTWGLSFLVLVLMETLAGNLFPLDILPHPVYLLLQLTPFPYLIYYPIAIFVGKITGTSAIQILLQSLVYCFVMYVFTKIIWKKGLKIYGSEGR